jgi:hypothetical protein
LRLALAQQAVEEATDCLQECQGFRAGAPMKPRVKALSSPVVTALCMGGYVRLRS